MAATSDLNDFDFELPKELIAQNACEQRDASRLLFCQGHGRLGNFDPSFEKEHRVFRELADILGPKDFLVFNDTKVLPVRLLGVRQIETFPHARGVKGGAVELLLLKLLFGKMEAREPTIWSALIRSSARVGSGMKLLFAGGDCEPIFGEVLSSVEERAAADGVVRVRLEGLSENWLEKYGHVPLPPYIRAGAVSAAGDTSGRARYQTVYAQHAGSAAAPTAGFHFTQELLTKLQENGVQFGSITLHVGLGTFRPIKSNTLDDHRMHEEEFSISSEFIDKWRKAKQEGRRVVAVGTTVVRALESWALQQGAAERRLLSLSPSRVSSSTDPNGKVGVVQQLYQRPVVAGSFKTSIFIRPGFQFQVVDDLITNFHLPKSSLLVLVAAAMGLEPMKRTYSMAVAEKYRFFSYGDAMFIRGVK